MFLMPKKVLTSIRTFTIRKNHINHWTIKRQLRYILILTTKIEKFHAILRKPISYLNNGTIGVHYTLFLTVDSFITLLGKKTEIVNFFKEQNLKLPKIDLLNLVPYFHTFLLVYYSSSSNNKMGLNSDSVN